MIFRYDPSDTFVIFGIHYSCTHQTDALCVFEPKNSADGTAKTLSRKEIAFLRRGNNWRFIPGPNTQECIRKSATRSSKSLQYLHQDDRESAVFAFMECMNLKAFHDAGAVKLTPRSLRTNWPKILGAFRVNEESRNAGDGPRRGGSALPPQRRPHSPETLLKLYRRLRKNNYDPSVLVPRYRVRKGMGRRFCRDTEDFISEKIRAYATQEKMSKVAVAKDTRDAIIAENKRRAERGIRALHVPSERTIERRIDLLDPFEVAVFRDGIDQARMDFARSSGGPDVLYPMERIEIDEWEVDVRTLFKRLAIWNELPADLREDVPSGRRWIYAAIDCATRCILAISVCGRPNADAARRVIGQILEDKTEFAQAVGAEGTWDFFGTPHLICSDTGSAFASNMFVTAVNSLGAIMLFPPIKIPELRSRIERVFGTMARQLMPRLPGRTFDSPKSRGNYPSEVRTVLTDEDLTRILTIWVVDHYHHQEHRGLPGGQSPASRWRELVSKYHVTEPPDTNTRRVALGYEFERVPSKQGVVLLSNHYSCPELESFWRHNKGKSVRLRIEPSNIGAVSVQIGTEWFPAPARNGEELEGMSLVEWTMVMREFRTRYAGEAKLTLPQRNRAIQKIKAIVGEACERTGLIDPDYSAEHLEYLENNLCAGLLFDHPDLPPASDDDVPFGRRIIPSTSVTKSEQTLAQKQTETSPAAQFNNEPAWKLEE